MAELQNRWPQFTLWSVFVLTTIAAVLVAACTGAFGRGVQISTVFGVSFAIWAALAFVAVVPPLLLLTLGVEQFARRLFRKNRKG